MTALVRWRQQGKKTASFLKKRSKKLLLVLYRAVETATGLDG
jgi:hypothetical protein